MIAAAEADRELIYFTFHDHYVTNKLKVIKEIIEKNNLNVCQIYEIIGQYTREIRNLSKEQMKKFGISQFMISKYSI